MNRIHKLKPERPKTDAKTVVAPKARMVLSLSTPAQSSASWRLHRLDIKPRTEERA